MFLNQLFQISLQQTFLYSLHVPVILHHIIITYSLQLISIQVSHNFHSHLASQTLNQIWLQTLQSQLPRPTQIPLQYLHHITYDFF